MFSDRLAKQLNFTNRMAYQPIPPKTFAITQRHGDGRTLVRENADPDDQDGVGKASKTSWKSSNQGGRRPRAIY